MSLHDVVRLYVLPIVRCKRVAITVLLHAHRARLILAYVRVTLLNARNRSTQIARHHQRWQTVVRSKHVADTVLFRVCPSCQTPLVFVRTRVLNTRNCCTSIARYQQRWQTIVRSKHVKSGTLDLRALCGSGSSDSRGAAARAAESDRTKLESRAEAVTPYFAAMEPVGVRLLSLGNYVERVAAAAVGAGSAGDFVLHCLASTRVADAP
jgi:hypothetical protein